MNDTPDEPSAFKQRHLDVGILKDSSIGDHYPRKAVLAVLFFTGHTIRYFLKNEGFLR